MSGGDRFTHFDEAGRAAMVDVSAKAETARVAVARGRVVMAPETLARLTPWQARASTVALPSFDPRRTSRRTGRASSEWCQTRQIRSRMAWCDR